MTKLASRFKLFFLLASVPLLHSCSSKVHLVESRNLDDPGYTSLTYSVADSNYLLASTDSLYYQRFDSTIVLKGIRGLFSPNEDQILSMEPHEDSSFLHLYDREAHLIRSIKIGGYLVDAVYSRKSKRFYALTKPKEDLNGRLLCIRRHGAIEFDVNIGLPKTHLTTLSFEPRRKWILVGNAVQGVIINKKGRVINSFNTPHFCYTAAHSHKLFSILHQYSDGSMLDLYKTPGESLGLIYHMYKDAYPLPNSEEYSSKARIRCWDLDPHAQYIATLDQSPFLSVYKMSGEVLVRKRIADDVSFCFFSRWNTVMLFHTKDKTWERVILPD